MTSKTWFGAVGASIAVFALAAGAVFAADGAANHSCAHAKGEQPACVHEHEHAAKQSGAQTHKHHGMQTRMAKMHSERGGHGRAHGDGHVEGHKNGCQGQHDVAK